MDGELRNGMVFTSASGYKYTINKLLGEGGQGAVYDVTRD